MMQRRPGRSGNVQILFAMLVFGLMAIAGLAIDLGIARFSQAHMQSTVDVTAYEGLRFLHEKPIADWRPDTVDLSKTDVDGDMNADQDAGPGFTLTGGIGEMNASALVQQPMLQVFLDLQTNDANAGHGDIVQGTFEDKFDTHPRKRESNDYIRSDFEPNKDEKNAVLVRARRTKSDVMPAADEEVGVSSSLPTLPLLFGMGSLVRPEATGYSVRKHGLSVRATAIANLRPVASVGLSKLATRPGVTPFTVTKAEWIAKSSDFTFDALVDFSASGLGPVLALDLSGTLPTPKFTDYESPFPTSYVPIIDTLGGKKVIVGFGRCHWEHDGATVTVAKKKKATDPPLTMENTSTAWVPAEGAKVATELLDAIVGDLSKGTIPDSIQAPALVR